MVKIDVHLSKLSQN